MYLSFTSSAILSIDYSLLIYVFHWNVDRSIIISMLLELCLPPCTIFNIYFFQPTTLVTYSTLQYYLEHGSSTKLCMSKRCSWREYHIAQAVNRFRLIQSTFSVSAMIHLSIMIHTNSPYLPIGDSRIPVAYNILST